jgi:hypothetical protein
MSALAESTPGNSSFAADFRARMKSLGGVFQQAHQVSVVNSDRIFLFHDWEDLVGTQAAWTSSDGEDIYDEIFRYPSGAVAWIDRVSNSTRRSQGNLDRRLNIALFATVAALDCRVIVETHHEVRNPE